MIVTPANVADVVNDNIYCTQCKRISLLFSCWIAEVESFYFEISSDIVIEEADSDKKLLINR